MSIASLTEFRPLKFPTIIIFVLIILFIPGSISAEDFASIWGQVRDNNQDPVPKAKITLAAEKNSFEKTVFSDPEGIFRISGLSQGGYTIRLEAEGYHPHFQKRIFLEPYQLQYFQVILQRSEEKKSTISQALAVDYSHVLHQTLLDKFQIQKSPSAHNIWSLIENQDLSATANRIDVGGLWGAIPGLFSSRGGCSWTQNIYLLNGLDVTDPYWTGRPLFYPDFYSLRLTRLVNAGHSPSALSPGGYFDLLTREGTEHLRGGIYAFFIPKKLQAENISPALENEGLVDSHSFNHLADANFFLSGSVLPGKLRFFTSFSSSHVSRDVAEFEEEDRSSILSGVLSLNYRYDESSLSLIWTGQKARYTSFGAGREIPFAATSDRRDVYNVFQGIWTTRIKDIHFLKAGICLVHGDIRSDYQEGISDQHGLEIFSKIPSGAAPFAERDRRSSLTFLFNGESLVSGFFKAQNRIQYGIQAQYCQSSSRLVARDNLHLHFFDGLPLEVLMLNTPVRHQEAALHLNLFAQDSIILRNFVSFYFGFNLAFSHGWLPSQELNTVFNPGIGWYRNNITWFNLSPRLGVILPLSKARASALKLSLARYYFTLPLHYLTYGSPSALGGKVYSWNDLNSDDQYQEGEAGVLIRREGPFFSTIDTGLKRPYTNELTVSYVHTFGANWRLSVAGFYRETRNLVETLNVGVPFSSYQPQQFYDIGDDRIPDTHDDLTFTVYNQDIGTLGQDFFLLTNPDSEDRISKYYGLDLTLVKKYSSKFTFFLSLTAISAVGSTNPGNTEWENDDGVIGSLYDNPNTLINSEGEMRFDRGYTGRIGVNFLAPLGIRVGGIIKYYDGQPFARKIIVTGMNQGPFYIQAHPRGVSRYEYNMTVDIRMEKKVSIGRTDLRIILDAFNLLNRALATEENEWTGPEFPLRFATEIQSPRVFRLGLAYEF